MIIGKWKIYQLFEIDTVFFNRRKTLKKLFFNKNETLTIFDVGAHIGESLIEFKEIFPNSLIHCFEPYEKSFRMLRKLDFKNVIFNNIAVGNNLGFKTFYVYNDLSEISSFFKIDENSLVFKNHVHAKVNKIKQKHVEVKVPVTTIETYCSENNVKKIDILKIDVQGYSREVLEGSKSMLKTNKVDVIIIEIIFDEIYGRRDCFYIIEKYLIPNNYIFWDISHIYKDLHNNRTNWIDAIYVSKLFLKRRGFI